MLASDARVARVRTAVGVLTAAAFATLCVDGGSVLLSTLQVTDASAQAARAASQAAAGQPVNQQTARAAYAAAVDALTSDRDAVVLQAAGEARDFRLAADGSVTLTVSRTAPTLLLARLPMLADYTDVAVTTHRPSAG